MFEYDNSSINPKAKKRFNITRLASSAALIFAGVLVALAAINLDIHYKRYKADQSIVVKFKRLEADCKDVQESIEILEKEAPETLGKYPIYKHCKAFKYMQDYIIGL